MKNNEIPRTMVQFLSIITGRQPHVVIGGPMAEPVAVTRLVAQGLFRTAAKRGYETRIVFDDQDRAAILHVQDIRQ